MSSVDEQDAVLCEKVPYYLFEVGRLPNQLRNKSDFYYYFIQQMSYLFTLFLILGSIIRISSSTYII